MLRECKRNSSLSFIVIVVVIPIVAFAVVARAQGIGDRERLVKPSALPERTEAQQPSILALDFSTPATNEDRSYIMTSNATAIIPNTRIFRWPTVYDSGGRLAQSVAVADLNGDVKPDMVVVNYDGSVGVLLGKGNGSFLPGCLWIGWRRPNHDRNS